VVASLLVTSQWTRQGAIDHQRKQAKLSRREQLHPTSRSRRTIATCHRGLFGSSLAMGVLSICTTENDPVKYNPNVSDDFMYLL